jgi:hypothetical protein
LTGIKRSSLFAWSIGVKEKQFFNLDTRLGSTLPAQKALQLSTSPSPQGLTPQRQAAEAKLSCLILKLSKEEQQLTGIFIGTMTCNFLFAQNDDIAYKPIPRPSDV